ncbi:MAG: aminotransferase class V-fold PLP-dependent enzyme [Myxococcota bacterium]
MSNAAPGVREAWPLDADVVFLNHGSFGACPVAVLEHQQALRMQLERNPVHFFLRQLEELSDHARCTLARFVGCHADDLVSVPNATTGVNAVLQSLAIRSGDEILLTDQSYPACKNAVHDICARYGAHVREEPLPVGPRSAEWVCDAIASHVSHRTRLALMDHVASPTGAILPVEQLVRMLHQRGVQVLVDGAHAPGLLPLDIDALGADYYVGNCHKWMCAPKGAGFLHVARQHQPSVHPVVVSLGHRRARRGRSVFATEFGWTGTHDPTAFLTVPFAIDYVGSLHPAGWAGIREQTHALLVDGVRVVARALGMEPARDDGWYGSMVALPLLDRKGREPGPGELDAWQSLLFERYGIEVPVITWPRHPKRLIRLSAHLYNDLEDYEALADGLARLVCDRR